MAAVMPLSVILFSLFQFAFLNCRLFWLQVVLVAGCFGCRLREISGKFGKFREKKGSSFPCRE